MKTKQNVPKYIYAICVIFALGYWFVFIRTNMDNLAKVVYAAFMLMIATPYIVWVIHKEGEEPKEYFQEMYGGKAGLIWFVRIFMMVVVSTLSLVAAIIVFGVIGLIAKIVQ